MRIFLWSFLVLLAGCSNADFSDNEHIWLDPDVLEKLQNSSPELLLSRPQLEFVNGSTVSSCEQYFRQNGNVVESAVNHAARSYYLVCDALKLSENWPPQALGWRGEEHLSLCSTLDLSGFSHSLRARIAGDKATLSGLFGSEAMDGLNTCSVQAEGRNFVLNAVLLVEEKQKPKEIWVWVIDEILDSTYRSYEPVWFVFDEARVMWVAKQ